MTSFRVRPAAVIAAFLLWANLASGEFALVELETVPVERLLKNLGDIVQKDPKNAQAVLNLARVHAMAYSLRTESLQVVKKQPDQLWFGYGEGIVPFTKVTPTQDPDKLKAAKAHLDRAITLYVDALKLMPEDLIAQLGHAWLLTRTQNKAEAIAALRKVIENSWEKGKEPQPLGLGLGVVVEAGQYLLPLLDPEKDKAEIAKIRERAEELNRRPRVVTPIAVPLRAGLGAADLEDRSASVAFDADGTGLPQRWTWTSRDAAWLVYDPNRSGSIRSGLQFFGSVSFWLFWSTGYDALEALDDNHDGQLTGLELEGLALWHDANGNGISESGEVRPLSAYGIVAISCRCERLQGHPDRIAFSSTGVTYKDGSTRPTFDLVLHSR